jgi:RNA polymerase sigma factor (sigma-70 family)
LAGDASDEEQDQEAIRAEVLRRLEIAIQQLPEAEIEIIRLSYIHLLKTKVIALKLGLSESTIEKRKARALVMLRALMGKSFFNVLAAI